MLSKHLQADVGKPASCLPQWKDLAKYDPQVKRMLRSTPPPVGLLRIGFRHGALFVELDGSAGLMAPSQLQIWVD